MQNKLYSSVLGYAYSALCDRYQAAYPAWNILILNIFIYLSISIYGALLVAIQHHNWQLFGA